MSKPREAPTYHDRNNRTSRQYGYAINGTTPIANRSEGRLKWKDEYAGDNGSHGVFDDQQRPPRLQCQGEQHTGSDRVHTASNGEKPPIQFGTRLQQHSRRRRHQHHSHHEEKASQDSDHPEDDHPYAVWSASTLGGRVLRRSAAHAQVGLFETSTSEAAGMCQSR
jgi:hypothetical protein